MPRPLTTIRVSDFLGENDDTPASIEDRQGSTVQDWYKDRRKLKRRKGFSALGSASLSPDQNLNGLEWCRISGTEHLIGVHSLDVVDFLHSTVGSIVGNGTNKLPTATDANMAFVDNRLYIGNGTDQNLRYNGRDAGLAADFTVSTTQGLKVAFGANALFAGADLTVAAWVYLDSLDVNATDTGVVGRVVIASEWDRSTASQRGWRLMLDPGTDRFVFQVRSSGGTETEVQDASVTLSTGVWYFVVGQHNAATDLIKVRVNLGTIATAAHTLGLNEPPNVDFYAGGMFNGSNTVAGVLDGRLATLGVWRSAEAGGGALSDTQLTTLYNSGIPLLEADLPASVDTSALVAYWDMGETSGTRDDDHSAASTFNLLEFGAATGSAEGPHAQFAVAVAMVPKPTTAPAAAGQVGAGAISAGTYFYRVSFLNADGVYGEASDAGTVTIATPKDITVSSIPVCPAGNDCTGRIIWRRGPTTTTYYLLTTITDNTTTTYNDVTDIISSNDELVDFNTRFPACKYLVNHQRRLIGAGNEDDPDQVFISNVDEPYYCPESPDLEDPNQGTRARVDSPAGGEITGLCSHGGVVAVFTGGQGHLLLGVEPNDFRLQKFCDVGCAAHRTICSARSLLLWLGHDGVYAWDGTSTKRISDDQRVTLDAMTAAEMAGAHAYVLDDRYHLCWATGAIYFDLEHGIWGTLSNWTWRDSTVAPIVSGNKPRAWAAREGAARVYQIETGATDAGTNISAVWESKDWDMGLPGREKRGHYLVLTFKQTDDPATCNWTLKRGTGETIQAGSVEIGQVDANGGTVSRHRIPLNEAARDEHFRLRLNVASPTAEVVLLSAAVEWTMAT
jgi:hypothetical protein